MKQPNRPRRAFKLRYLLLAAFIPALYACIPAAKPADAPTARTAQYSQTETVTETDCAHLPRLDWSRETPELHQRRAACFELEQARQWQQEQAAYVADPLGGVVYE